MINLKLLSNQNQIIYLKIKKIKNIQFCKERNNYFEIIVLRIWNIFFKYNLTKIWSSVTLFAKFINFIFKLTKTKFRQIKIEMYHII